MEPEAIKLRDQIQAIDHHGVPFYDVVGLLQNPLILRQVIDWMVDTIRQFYPTAGYLVVPDSRGYIFTGVGQRLGMTVIFAPKGGKLPESLVDSVSYGTEYSKDVICIRKNSISRNGRVVIIDDVIATGGSFRALRDLVKMQGGKVVGGVFVIDAGILTGSLDCYYHSYIYMSGPMSKLVRYRPLPTEIQVPHSTGEPIILSSPVLEYMAKNVYGNYLQIQWGRFPDGTHNIKFPACLKGQKVKYFMSLHPDFIWQEMLVMEVLARQGLHSLRIYIPYVPSGTMERVTEPGVLATVEVELRKLSEQPITRTGPARVHFLDAHAPVSLFYLRDSVHVVHHSAIPLLKEINNVGNIVVVFPDDGSYKRFAPDFRGYPIIVCTKLRDPQNPLSRKVTINEMYGMPEGFDYTQCECLIVDDLVHSGGTLLECAKMLKALGVNEVSAYVTHMVGENNGFEKLINGPFKYLYFTDSTPTALRAYEYSQDVVTYSYHGATCILISAASAMGCGRNSKQHDVHEDLAILASTSQVKALGVYQHLLTEQIHNLYLYEADSGIAAQPIGLEETKKGVRNRSQQVPEKLCFGEPSYIYAVESGLERIMPSEVNEITVVLMRMAPTQANGGDKNDIIQHYNVSPIWYERFDVTRNTIPEHVISPYLKDIDWESTGNSTTFGQYLEKTGGYSSDDWHRRVLGVSRSHIITMACNPREVDEGRGIYCPPCGGDCLYREVD